MTRKLILSATVAALVLISVPVHAASISNGGFEANPVVLTSWNKLGSALSLDFQPSEGFNHALIDTTTGATIPSSLEGVGALDLSPNTLSSIGSPGTLTRGSAIWQNGVVVNAGDILKFDLNFLTDVATQTLPSPNGFAFFSWSSGSTNGAVKLVDFTAGSLVNSNTQFDLETGYVTYMHTFAASGTYRLGFGVADEGTSPTLNSVIFVDNVRFVPLPAAAWMALPLIGGLGVTQIIRRRRLAM